MDPDERSGLRFWQIEEFPGDVHKHIPVFGHAEIQAVFIDHLDAHVFPGRPANPADRVLYFFPKGGRKRRILETFRIGATTCAMDHGHSVSLKMDLSFYGKS